jgi:hypothetical protein
MIAKPAAFSDIPAPSPERKRKLYAKPLDGLTSIEGNSSS